MKTRTLLPAVLTLALVAAVHSGLTPADEPKAAEPGTLVIVDGAGKEHKLKSWKFTAGIRHLTWLAPVAPPEKDPEEKKEKGSKAAPKAKPLAGPEAFIVREDNSTTFENGVETLVPLDRLRAIDYDAEKQTIAVRVSTSAKAEQDLTLTGPTKFLKINKLGIDAEVDKGDLGVADVRFLGGVPRGIRGVRFPAPKPPAEAKEGRPAAISYGDSKGKHVVNVADLQALYRTTDGEVLSGLLFFKKTIKIDVAKLKKITLHKEERETVWGLTLKSGDEEMLSLLPQVQLDGKDALLEGLLARVPAGYKLFPVHLMSEIEFDVKKDESEAKPEK